MSRIKGTRRAVDSAATISDPDEFEILHGPCPNLEAALALASRGLKVFPILYRKTRNKWTPISGWQSNGTADPEAIRKLWNRTPEPRVGLQMGAINGMVALDVDRKNGKDGFKVLHALGLDPETMTLSRTTTPSGGAHLFFAFTEGLKNWVGGTKKGLPLGLDIRTDGGFVVAPGTVKDLNEWYAALGEPLGTAELPPFPEAVSNPLIERETSGTHRKPAGARKREPAMPSGSATDDQKAWAAARLEDWADDLAELPHGGGRNCALNNAAYWAGGAAAHGLLVEAEARRVLGEAAKASGLDEAEFGRTFGNGWAAGLKQPISDYPREFDLNEFDDISDDEDDDTAASSPPGTQSQWTIGGFDPEGDPDLSHDQLALDLGKAGWNRDARYCAPLGGWLLWRGHHWEVEPGMRPMAVVRGFVRTKARRLVEWAEAKAEKLDQRDGEKLLGHMKSQAKALRQDASIAAVERLARSNVKALAVPEQFDADDFLLGTPEGTVDLRTGEMRTARHEDYITYRTSVAPAAPGTSPSAWLQFLGEVFPDDPEMVGFIQRLAGYALTGSTREHRLFLFWGTGRNGKGTLLGTLQSIMGDYAKGIPTTTLLESRSPQHASPLARLRGARFVRGAELPVGQAWNESLVKQLTGGDIVTANLMRQDSFDFLPKFTLIVDGNTKPRIRTIDVATRERMTLVPFTVNFAGREDRTLKDRLVAEAAAILRWAIEGAVEWQRSGLRIPATVAEASRDYLDSEDTPGQFLTDRTIESAGHRVSIADLYAEYRSWSVDAGSNPASMRAFGSMLTERGVERCKGTGGRREVVGLRLRIDGDFDDVSDDAL